MRAGICVCPYGPGRHEAGQHSAFRISASRVGLSRRQDAAYGAPSYPVVFHVGGSQFFVQALEPAVSYVREGLKLYYYQAQTRVFGYVVRRISVQQGCRILRGITARSVSQALVRRLLAEETKTKEQQAMVKDSLTRAYDQLHSGQIHTDVNNIFAD